MVELKALILRNPLLRRRRDVDAPPPYAREDPYNATIAALGPASSTQPRRRSLGWNRNGGGLPGSGSRGNSTSPNGIGRRGRSSMSESRARGVILSVTAPPPPPPLSVPLSPPPHESSFTSTPMPPAPQSLQPAVALPVHDTASPPYSPTLYCDPDHISPFFPILSDTLIDEASSRSRSSLSSRGSLSRRRTRRAPISSLPLGLLHHILMLTLDPTVTPSHESYLDPELEPILRVSWLFNMRGVDRRFFLVATSILRDRLIPTYISLLPFGVSSDPHPPGGDGEDPTGVSVFAQRPRETAVLDRFIALRVGEDLRKAESSLHNESGEQANIFSVLQPIARTEDLLLLLPASLISPTAPAKGILHKTFPLPHPHLMIQNTPLWTSLYVSEQRVDLPQSTGWRAPRRVLVVEIRRRESPEETVVKLKEALDHIRRGWREWGDRIA